VVLDTNEGTVAWRVHEARNQLRKHVAEAMTVRPARSATEPAGADAHATDEATVELALALLAPS